MAIDLFGIPAMSSEPERLFSETGDMVTLKRNRLHADIIGAGMCLKQWDCYGYGIRHALYLAIASQARLVWLSVQKRPIGVSRRGGG